MKKTLLKFSCLLVINLLAFLFLGHILDLLFGGGVRFKVIFLIVSIVPLLLMGSAMLKKSLQKLQDIQTPKK